MPQPRCENPPPGIYRGCNFRVVFHQPSESLAVDRVHFLMLAKCFNRPCVYFGRKGLGFRQQRHLARCLIRRRTQPISRQPRSRCRDLGRAQEAGEGALSARAIRFARAFLSEYPTLGAGIKYPPTHEGDRPRSSTSRRRFEWTQNAPTGHAGPDFGFIAEEEVVEVLPEGAALDEHGKALGVDYARLTALLVEAIKTQQRQIDVLRDKLDQMQDEIALSHITNMSSVYEHTEA